jgi:hypothetical protein
MKMSDPSTPTRRTAAEDYPTIAEWRDETMVFSVAERRQFTEALAEIDRLRAAVSSPPADVIERAAEVIAGALFDGDARRGRLIARAQAEALAEARLLAVSDVHE